MDGRRIERPPGGPLRVTVVSEGVHIHLGLNATRSSVLSEASVRALSTMTTILARQIAGITGNTAEWDTRGTSVENVLNEAVHNMEFASSLTMIQPSKK